MKKFILTDETIEYSGRTLHRIKAVRSFRNVKEGDLGGFVEKEDNVSDNFEAWVRDNAKVCDNAQVLGNAVIGDNAVVCDNAVIGDNAVVCDNAKVCDNAVVCDKAKVCDNAEVYDKAKVCDNAEVFDNAEVCVYAVVCGNAVICGNAVVCGNSDYIVFKNWWSGGRHFTWTRSNNMWSVGCFYGTGEELIKKAYQDSEKSGREYKRVVEYVQSILEDEKP